ncbi:MAG: VOC family protein [Candidatus Poribacteria bacterium]|nr:VOC family protein [Candidatus Poribacteria bacterium]
MLHHLSFAVADIDAAAKFYDAALAPLGYVRVASFPDAIGYGYEGGGDKFAIKLDESFALPTTHGFHVAFAATKREDVDAFYAAAMINGGTDNGAPELCVDYGPHYYAAFVFDPDGYPIEAVINTPI